MIAWNVLASVSANILSANFRPAFSIPTASDTRESVAAGTMARRIGDGKFFAQGRAARRGIKFRRVAVSIVSN
jgi:hypothetical protein